MAENGNKPHFILEHTSAPEPFRPPGGGGGGSGIPRRNRHQHGGELLSQLDSLKPEISQARARQEDAGMEDGFGLQVEFESFPEIELAFESLAKERSGIDLLNVRHEQERTMATIFVPDGKLHILENQVMAYLDKEKDTDKGVPRNQKLLDAIRNIRIASLKALWTDDPGVFPEEEDEPLWWEVWLPVRGSRFEEVYSFKKLAENLGFRTAKGQIEFPERTVLLLYGTVRQMQHSVLVLNSIAELRRAKETADFFDSIPPDEQPEWVDELLQRLSVPSTNEPVPYVCILDTGVNRGHPLLEDALAVPDLHTVEPGWGTNDSHGHGTEMAGLALLGNLTPLLDSDGAVSVSHRLESSKLLDGNNNNNGDPDYHGYLTMQAVNRPEIPLSLIHI